MSISGKRDISAHFYQYGSVLALGIGLLLWILWPAKQEEARSIEDYMINIQEAEKLLSGKNEVESLVGDKKAGLFFDGYETAFDREDRIFYISQSLAGGEWQGDLRPYGADFYILSDEYAKEIPKAIAEGHVFHAVFYTEDGYQRAGIVLTGMPVVKIDTAREEAREYPIEDIDNYVFNSETRYYGKITVFQSGVSALPKEEDAAEGGYQILQRQVCYHERGQNSALFSKKSYAVKLLDQQEKSVSESLFGMERSAEWKLLAMYSDPNKIRDKVSMDIWEEIAAGETEFNEKGPEMEYCEVILDEKYMGLYGMMLPVDEHTLELGRKNVLYKILDWYMPESADIQASIDQNYEVCYPVRIRYPEKNGSVEKLWEPIIDYFTCKYWSIDFNAYSEMSYVENLADYYIFIQAVSGYDNYLKNTYISAEEADDGAGYKMITIPWDLNYTFGNCYSYDPEKNYTEFNYDTNVNYVEPVLEQLFRSSFNGEGEVLKERWSKYRTGTLSTEHLTEFLQNNMDYIQRTGAFERDSKEWEGALNSSDLAEVEEYVKARMLYLDEYFGNF